MALNSHETGSFQREFSPLADWLVFQDYLDLAGDPDLVPNPSRTEPGRRNGGRGCPDPLTRLAILADGGMFPCCSDFARLSPMGRLPGDTIAGVWRSRAAEELSRNQNHPSCQLCLAAAAHNHAPAGLPAGERPMGTTIPFGPRRATC
jgi:hypothetical protein